MLIEGNASLCLRWSCLWWLWNAFGSVFCNGNIYFVMLVYQGSSRNHGEWMIVCKSSINDELSLTNHDVIASLWCWFWTIILLAALIFGKWMVNSEGKESMCV